MGRSYGGYLTLAERIYTDGPAFAEGWNFGSHSDDAQPVEWIVKELAQRWGQGASWQVDDGEHPHEAHYLKLDISKTAQRLPWALNTPPNSLAGICGSSSKSQGALPSAHV